MNLANILTTAAARDAGHVAVRLDDGELSYGQLDGATAHIAGLLHANGFSRGDRVGIMLPNVPHFAVCYYGVLRAGGVVVPMNVLLKRREVAFYLSDSGAKLLFAWHGFAEDAQSGADAAGAECILVEPERVRADRRGRCPDHRHRRQRRRGHRGDPLHVGDDRNAEGRRADPREPAAQRADHAGPVQPRRRERDARRAAAVSLLRPDLLV